MVDLLCCLLSSVAMCLRCHDNYTSTSLHVMMLGHINMLKNGNYKSISLHVMMLGYINIPDSENYLSTSLHVMMMGHLNMPNKSIPFSHDLEIFISHAIQTRTLVLLSRLCSFCIRCLSQQVFLLELLL